MRLRRIPVFEWSISPWRKVLGRLRWYRIIYSSHLSFTDTRSTYDVQWLTKNEGYQECSNNNGMYSITLKVKHVYIIYLYTQVITPHYMSNPQSLYRCITHLPEFISIYWDPSSGFSYIDISNPVYGHLICGTRPWHVPWFLRQKYLASLSQINSW